MNNDTESNSKPRAPCGCKECGVFEEQFPLIGKCCRKLIGPGGTDYEKICPDCAIWISRPDPTNLEVAAIFECRRHGYCKRIKNI